MSELLTVSESLGQTWPEALSVTFLEIIFALMTKIAVSEIVTYLGSLSFNQACVLHLRKLPPTEIDLQKYLWCCTKFFQPFKEKNKLKNFLKIEILPSAVLASVSDNNVGVNDVEIWLKIQDFLLQKTNRLFQNLRYNCWILFCGENLSLPFKIYGTLL